MHNFVDRLIQRQARGPVPTRSAEYLAKQSDRGSRSTCFAKLLARIIQSPYMYTSTIMSRSTFSAKRFVPGSINILIVARGNVQIGIR